MHVNRDNLTKGVSCGVMMLMILLLMPLNHAFANGVYQGYWCSYGGSCYQDSGSSYSSSSSCSGNGPCIPMLFCLFPGVCKGWYGGNDTKETKPSKKQTVYVPGPTKADRVSLKSRTRRIRALTQDLRPAQASARYQSTVVSSSGVTPIFGHHNAPFSGFTPTSYTPGTPSAMKALRRSVAILALAESSQGSGYDQAFFGQQAAAALSGQPFRVDMLEPDDAIDLSAQDTETLSVKFAEYARTGATVEETRRRRQQLEEQLTREMQDIAEDLPPACFVEGFCTTPEAKARKKRLDQTYIDYRHALKEEGDVLRLRDAFAVGIRDSLKKRVHVKVVRSGRD